MIELSAEQKPTDPNTGLFSSSTHFHSDVKYVVLPLKWDATTSYHSGASNAPEAIIHASHQLEDYHHYWGGFCSDYIYFDKDFLKEIGKLNAQCKEIVNRYRLRASSGDLEKVNALCSDYNRRVEERYDFWFKKGVKVLGLGGDHGSSYPLMARVLSKQVKQTTVIHIDAHFDLRESYEGFTFSHASVLKNIYKLNLEHLKFLHLGMRDFCQAEHQCARSNKSSIFYLDEQIKEHEFCGGSWDELCEKFLDFSSEHIYITLDIDGMSPLLSPGTGTPVPGGLDFQKLIYLLKKLSKNKQLVGFDLVEVAPRDGDLEWNANVGARVLQQLLYLLNHQK